MLKIQRKYFNKKYYCKNISNSVHTIQRKQAILSKISESAHFHSCHSNFVEYRFSIFYKKRYISCLMHNEQEYFLDFGWKRRLHRAHTWYLIDLLLNFDKYISKSRQMHFTVSTNTFENLDKYILKNEPNMMIEITSFLVYVWSDLISDYYSWHLILCSTKIYFQTHHY